MTRKRPRDLVDLLSRPVGERLRELALEDEDQDAAVAVEDDLMIDDLMIDDLMIDDFDPRMPLETDEDLTSDIE